MPATSSALRVRLLLLNTRPKSEINALENLYNKNANIQERLCVKIHLHIADMKIASINIKR